MHGRRWSFVDKYVIFTSESLSANSSYPVPVLIDCEILSTSLDANGTEMLLITTERPWGLASADEQTRFLVARSQLECEADRSPHG